MKKQTIQSISRIPIPTLVWSLFVFSTLVYCGTVGMITFDVVGRKSLNQEAQKVAALVAKQEEVLSEKTKLLSLGSPVVAQSRVAAYIDSRDVTAVGFAQ